MTRALVLNACSSWAAYQVGALRHLVVERGLHFDLCAGTGIGAMNAALVGCGQVAALERFWRHIGLRRLVAPNWDTPWREGPLTGVPQRRFIAAHVSDERLRARGVTLLLNVLNVRTGREEVLRYPGGAGQLPLVDALMAAVATPGLCRPIADRGRHLGEGTLITSFLLPAVLRDAGEIDEIVAIAPALPPGGIPRRYTTWWAVLERALAMNLAHDVRAALDEAEKVTAATGAFRHVRALVPARVADAAGPALGERLRADLEAIYRRSAFPLQHSAGPAVRAIAPSRDLGYPLWRFRRGDLARARDLGYRDAHAAMGDTS